MCVARRLPSQYNKGHFNCLADNKHFFKNVRRLSTIFLALREKKKSRRYRSQFNKANNNSHNDAINAHGCCKNALTVYRDEKLLRAPFAIKKSPRSLARARIRQSPTQRQPRLWRLNYTLLFFSARRRASAIIRLVGTLRSGLIELTIRQWHAEKREAHRERRGAAKRQQAGLSCIWSVSLY